MTQTIEQLTARVRELEEENARLSEVVESNIDDGINKIMAMSDEQVSALAGFEGSNPEDKATIARQCVDIAMLRVDLAAEQLNNKLLREALTRIGFDESCFEASENPDDWPVNVAIEALSLPASTEALDAYVAELEGEVERLSAAHVKACQANADSQAELAAEQLNNKLLRDTANECRLDLLIQVHELADHIERANYCISDPDMQKQINGQREYAISVASKWNQNGNPFLANQPDTSVLDAYVAKRLHDMACDKGLLRIQVEELTRQRDLAVEALEITVNSWSEQFERHGHLAPEWAVKCRNAISTIKESEK